MSRSTEQASQKLCSSQGCFHLLCAQLCSVAVCSCAVISQQTALELKDLKLTGLDGNERDIDWSENKNSEDEVFHGAGELNDDGQQVEGM